VRVDVVDMAQVDHNRRRVVPEGLQDAVQEGSRSLLELAAQPPKDAAVEPPLELNCQAFRAHSAWTLLNGYPGVTCPSWRASGVSLLPCGERAGPRATFLAISSHFPCSCV
jgi:hypothetical protein